MYQCKESKRVLGPEVTMCDVYGGSQRNTFFIQMDTHDPTVTISVYHFDKHCAQCVKVISCNSIIIGRKKNISSGDNVQFSKYKETKFKVEYKLATVIIFQIYSLSSGNS